MAARPTSHAGEMLLAVERSASWSYYGIKPTWPQTRTRRRMLLVVYAVPRCPQRGAAER